MTAGTAATAGAAGGGRGLSEAEAAARRARGQGNEVSFTTGRTYGQIVRDNVFNVVNDLLFALGITLIALGRYLDALVSVGVVAANAVVSLFQEIRAKRLLDRIAILTRPQATVVREGREQQIDPSLVVLGDLLVARSGDQIVVDGRLADGGALDADESLLTGESNAVRKRTGDELLSGSFVVTGGGRFVAERVGAESFANRITAQAQAHRRVLTPLQRQVSVIIRILLGIVVVFEALVVVKSIVGHVPFVETVRMSTVVIALIPNGLILAIALAYALGAARMAGRGTLVQQANAVESLSNVDVLCTDKTGTLTTNALTFADLEPLEADETELRRLLGVYAASVGDGNKTIAALAAAFPAQAAATGDEAPFSSQRKWSALTFAPVDSRAASAGDETPPALPTTPAASLVLGAPEVLWSALPAGPQRDSVEHSRRLTEWTDAGLRVLLLAGSPTPATLTDAAGDHVLPAGLRPLGLICLADELRPHVQDTLREFGEAGIAIKVISGDNPQTVAALAAQAGLDRDPSSVSGAELEATDAAGFADAAARVQVFGRVTPEQKARLADALRGAGHYVAMMGDGVNDVIALKRANLAIAVQSGSQAARAVADLILLKDSFAALPDAFREGQRIRKAMVDVVRIFLVRILSKALMIAAMLPLGGFPFAPRNSSLLSFLGAGIPVIGLTVWSRPGRPETGSIYRPLARFCLPPVVFMAAIGTTLHLLVRRHYEVAYLQALPTATGQMQLDHALPYAQTATIVFMILCSLLLLVFTVPPVRWLAGGAPLRDDWRPTWLALGLVATLAVILALPFLRHLFELTALPIWLYAVAAGLAALWGVLVLAVWRSGLLDRLLHVRSSLD